MPAPTEYHLTILGPSVLPFERRGFDRELQEGEAIPFFEYLYDATEDGKPEDVVEVNPDTIELDPESGRYLWVMRETGLHIILEATPNPEAPRKIVCHTNITGGERALIGGELWFGTDEKVYINFQSGRYSVGATEEQEQVALEYFQFVGYANVVVL